LRIPLPSKAAFPLTAEDPLRARETDGSLKIPPPYLPAAFPLTEAEPLRARVPYVSKIPPPMVAMFPLTDDESTSVRLPRSSVIPPLEAPRVWAKGGMPRGAVTLPEEGTGRSEVAGQAWPDKAGTREVKQTG
jgi:hypothetical protein